MPVAWYIAEYTVQIPGPRGYKFRRYIDMPEVYGNPDAAQSNIEIAGNQAIVKVEAPQEVLDSLDKRFTRLPNLEEDISVTEKVRSLFRKLGKDTQDIDRMLGSSIRTEYVLRHLLSTPRQKPRLDEKTGKVVLDGDPIPCEYIDKLKKRDLGQEISFRKSLKNKLSRGDDGEPNNTHP